MLPALNLSHSACKKSWWLTLLLLKYNWFKNLKIWLAENIFKPCQTKNLPTTFYVSLIFICWAKITPIHQFLHAIYLIQVFCNPIGQRHFLIKLNQKLWNHLLSSLNLSQVAKSQADWLHCSWDIAWFNNTKIWLTGSFLTMPN